MSPSNTKGTVMLDVHVVTSLNRHLYAAAMDESFAWRYKIYVLEKHWMPENTAEREIDQFDRDDAFYLLASSTAVWSRPRG